MRTREWKSELRLCCYSAVLFFCMHFCWGLVLCAFVAVVLILRQLSNHYGIRWLFQSCLITRSELASASRPLHCGADNRIGCIGGLHGRFRRRRHAFRFVIVRYVVVSEIFISGSTTACSMCRRSCSCWCFLESKMRELLMSPRQRIRQATSCGGSFYCP